MLRKRLTFVLLFAVPVLMVTDAYASIGGISNRDGYSADCSTCHTGSPYINDDATAATPRFTGLTSRAIGSSGAYSVRGETSNAVENGFNASVRDAAGNTVGAFSSLGTDVEAGTNNDVRHSAPTAAKFTYTFDWTAPTTPGSYTMYACVNQVNGNNLDGATDGPPLCGTRSISVTNTAPVAVNDTASVAENSTVILNVKTAGTNDSDGDAGATQTLTVTSVSQPANPAPNGTTSESGVTDGEVTYDPNGQFESLAVGESTTDTFTYVLSDGIDTDTGTVTITINGANDSPSVSVNGVAAYAEGDAPVILDAVISISDVDTSDLINRARVVIGSYQASEDVLACAGTLGAGKLSGITACNFSAGTLELLGTTSRANYANALETVTYENTSLNPVVGDRIISFDVRDDSGTTSMTDSVTVSVSSVSTPPAISGFTGTAAFIEGAAVQVNGAVGITDPDSGAVLNRATMILTAPNYISAEDRLICPVSLPAGMSCLYSAGTLTISSATTNSYAEYITALQQVSYDNSSENPNQTLRSVTLTVRDDSATVTTPAASKFISVTRVNDPPSMTSTAAVTATEDIAYNYTPTVSDPDDIAAGITFTISSAPAGSTFNTATGAFSWTPPRTNTFSDAIATFRIEVEDGNEDVSAPDFENISLLLSPPDGDADGVADYADNCPAVANGIAGDNQSDNDNDTVYIANAGFPAIGDVDQSDALTGGDACDTDDDNDGMPDLFENMFAFLSAFDAADAALDQDGDGLTNLEEYNNDNTGATIATDSVGPVIIAPPDITLDANGLLTSVLLGSPSGNDGNEGEVLLFKVAVDLTPAQIVALETPVIGCQMLVDFVTDVELFSPGSHAVTWASCDSSGNSGHDEQVVNIKPLASVISGQSVGEGQSVNVNVSLNGPAIAYPASVGYSLSGTATVVDDHDAVDGRVVFNTPGDIAVINFNTNNDAVVETDETVVVTLHTPDNVALSNSRVHTVVITEANVAPQVVLSVTQAAAALDINKGNTLYTSDGAATIIATANDGNGDVLSYDWSDSDSALLAISTITSNQIDFDPNALTVGNFYKVIATVSDGNAAVTVQRLLHIKAAEVNTWLITDDDDGDGITNLNEGYGDDDGDGIANYKDHNLTPPSAIENQTVNLETSIYIETDPGLKIALGETAVAAQASGVLIGMQDIASFGGAGGIAVSNATSDHTFFSALLDFEVSGLTDDIESVHVIIPLLSTIQKDAVYRKYNSSGWFDFVEDDLNELRSAEGSNGTCPQPGSNLYTAGLTAGHLCLQLTIQDGGANDADGVRNFIVKDPGGLALASEQEEVAVVADASGRAGSVSLWFMLCLLLFTVIFWQLKMKHRGCVE